MCSQTSEASSTHIPEAGTCSSWTSDSYSACSPSGAVSGRNHTDTWAGCIVSLTTPARPLPTNLMLMVLVSWGGGEVYSSTSTSSPDHEEVIPYPQCPG